jgi:trehalose 6-phosphate synthase
MQNSGNNFLDTVDRVLESRIDWEHFAVERGGQTTLVKSFPISIAFPDQSNASTASNATKPTKESLLKGSGRQGKTFRRGGGSH